MKNSTHPLKGRKPSAEVVRRRIEAGAGRPKNTPEILWSKVDKRGPDECWPWLGFKNAQGYGRTWINDKGYYAHRVIFDLASPGVISLEAPKTTQTSGFVMHTCDNPPCCNPSHLRVGTHADNMADKKAKGRAMIFTSVTSPRAKLTRENVLEIRQLSGYLLSSGEIARVFGVSRPTIKSVIAGRSYADIQ